MSLSVSLCLSLSLSVSPQYTHLHANFAKVHALRQRARPVLHAADFLAYEVAHLAYEVAYVTESGSLFLAKESAACKAEGGEKIVN